MQSADGDLRYKLLPVVIRTALVQAQTCTESECQSMQELSLKKEHLLVKKAILDYVMKEVVRFYSPVCNQPEKIPVTQDLKKAVKSAHAAYKE